MIIDIQKIPSNNKIIKSFKDRPIILSTLTTKFCEFRKKYYNSNKPKTKFAKIFHGQILAFKNLKNLVDGNIFWNYPSKPIRNFCYTGILIHKKELFACNKNVIEIFKSNKRKIIRNPYFNDLHYLCISNNKKKLLVTSSGTDLLIEIDLKNYNESWKWLFNKKIKDSKNYSKDHISTEKQITHVNTAVYFDKKGNIIGTTLFHQGQGVIINKIEKTKKVVIGSQKKPHGFLKFGGKYVITDTANGTVRIFNKHFKEKVTIKNFSRTEKTNKIWIQNTQVLSNSLLVINNQNENELIFLNIKRKEKYCIKYNKDWKIYQILFSDNINFLYE